MHSMLIALATAPAPAPSPSMRPGLSPDQVTPGLLGFLLTAFIVLLTALLIVDMVRRIRRVRYRAQVEEERAAAEAAEPDDAARDRQPQSRDVRSPQTQSPGAKSQDVKSPDVEAPQDSAGAAGSRPEINGDAGPGTR